MARVRLSLGHAIAKKETTDIETLISDQSQSLQNLEVKYSIKLRVVCLIKLCNVSKGLSLPVLKQCGM